jgi:hypothetical protein
VTRRSQAAPFLKPAGDQFNAATKLKAMIIANAPTVVNRDIFRSVSMTTPLKWAFLRIKGAQLVRQIIFPQFADKILLSFPGL